VSEIEFNVDWVRADFLKLFKKDMQERGVSRKQLAELMGVSKSNVSQILNGKRNIRVKTMVRLARALKMKMAIVGYISDEPIEAERIRQAWIAAGCPRNFWEVQRALAPLMSKEER